MTVSASNWTRKSPSASRAPGWKKCAPSVGLGDLLNDLQPSAQKATHIGGQEEQIRKPTYGPKWSVKVEPLAYASAAVDRSEGVVVIEALKRTLHHGVAEVEGSIRRLFGW
jgi:hypothetical protein